MIDSYHKEEERRKDGKAAGKITHTMLTFEK